MISIHHIPWQLFGIYVLKIFCLPYHTQGSFFGSILLLLLFLVVVIVVAAAVVVVVVVVFTRTAICCKHWLPI